MVFLMLFIGLYLIATGEPFAGVYALLGAIVARCIFPKES